MATSGVRTTDPIRLIFPTLQWSTQSQNPIPTHAFIWLLWMNFHGWEMAIAKLSSLYNLIYADMRVGTTKISQNGINDKKYKKFINKSQVFYLISCILPMAKYMNSGDNLILATTTFNHYTNTLYWARPLVQTGPPCPAAAAARGLHWTRRTFVVRNPTQQPTDLSGHLRQLDLGPTQNIINISR